jgi:ubiquinone biosynthesis protein UbiJ
MDSATKKFIQEENEKLAFLISQHIGRLEDTMATKEDIARLEENIAHLEDKVDSGFGKQLEETDGLRDRMRVLETRVDRIEASH